MHYPSWLKPEIFPNFHIGTFTLRWYALGYIIAFLLTYILAKRLHEKEPFLAKKEQLADILFSGMLGLIIGARAFYVLFYDFSSYMQAPWTIIIPYQNGQFGISGLSYHGGAVGAFVGVLLYVRKHRISFWRVTDLFSAVIPFGYTFGRLGNFANAELYGKATAGPLGMIFPDATPFATRLAWVRDIASQAGMEISGAYINLPRHPSQLYEALFEGVILGLVLVFIVRPRVRVPGQVFAFYLMGYGVARFFIEYLREPDSQLGYIIALGAGKDTPGVFVSWFNFSMGQLMSFSMILLGAMLYFILGALKKSD
ncbi:prolipoprotein diacylglyceryl transferase [Entomospira culicis]|uniref:Phosphatidylglycerol--prolipoprotein diacylglyceryl transferase n=1 Tax=Entomospira culicis TaxID=2719989 RepID=A0A968GF03_9SPIO|nr:prolipoprotein diacylglyceryl transferase [Entomospira culicis]NIZ18410.1 prolipoprotein diacylglyceryl transferase [Entomospira culicis]NIZ68626.1 prolipoprotein diacylglyceryl transferase [Entomospira culicis]WDI37226.1 prolipoprotein diacylglyceryl transferase [Entomospira culicis]WDI38854.1 prolipoprotein diacylglyceryl transferase [Entomospira culicis]